MRLRSLEISDFRKFDRPVRIEGLGDGINVLSEPNEFGKSTLLAAIKAVLFERHAARTRTAQRMQHHRNATSPVIRMGFELADGLHHVEKRFMHREPYARLSLPDGTRLEGDAAEEHLQSLLGFSRAGKQGATPETEGLWGALWVRQTGSVEQPELSDGGRSALHACLASELGSLTGDDRGGALRQEVQTALSRLIDGNGNRKGRLKEAATEAVAAEADAVRLRLKRDALASDIERRSKARLALALASNADDQAQLNVDLTDARARRDAVLLHSQALATAIAERELAEQRHLEAFQETTRRASRSEDAQRAAITLGDAKKAEADTEGDLRDAEGVLAAQRSKVISAESAATEAAGRARASTAMSALVERARRCGTLGKQLDRAVAAQEAEADLKGKVAAVLADGSRLREVRAAASSLASARSVLDALATELEFELDADSVRGITASGINLPIGRTKLRITAETSIEIAGIGRLHVRPAIRNRATLESAIRAAEAKLQEALEAAGASDPDDAAAKAERRSALEDLLRNAGAALAAETAGDDEAGLAPGLDALRDHVAALRGALEPEMGRLGISVLPTAAEATEAVREAAETEQEAVDAVDEERIAMGAPEAARAVAFAAHATAAAKTTKAQEEVERLCLAAAKAIAVEDDATLAARLEAASAAFDLAQDAATDLERKVPTDTLEGLDARIARLEQAVANRVKEVRDLKQDIAVLGASISRDEGEGIDEQIAASEASGEALRREQDGFQREADMLSLLRDTLQECEREARRRYVDPVVRRLTPYLQNLFPGVEVACGDQLQVTGLTRRGGAEEFERLSDGTREQVAVLLRLAYADLLAERGRPAMLILDDALAYSDHERLEQMFDVLHRAAARMQILVLTCRTTAFDRLGGNRVRLVPGTAMP